MPRIRTALVLFVFVLTASAGCGDEEGDESTMASAATSSTTGEQDAGSTATGEAADDAPPQGRTDRKQIEAAIEAFLVSPDSGKVCKVLVTERLLRGAYGDIQGCLSGRGAPTLASAIETGELEISGARAAVTAVPRGGVYAGSDVDFTLVLEGGVWRIDSVEADIPVGP